MALEAAAEQTIEKEPSVSLPFPKAVWGRVVYGLFVTVLPALSFSVIKYLKPEWQDGELRSYAILLLFPEASWLFFPLLAYSIICYLLFLFAPVRFSKFFAVRCGIYMGVLLALQYSVLMLGLVSSFVGVLVVIWILPIVFEGIYRWGAAKGSVRSANNVLFLLIAALVVGGMWTGGSFLLMGLVMAAPFWSLLLSLRAANWLFKNYETRISLSHGLGLAAWFSAYAIAWRFDILKMYELYAALPKQPPPDCYIATAAARGHPRFVRAWTVQRADGKAMQVNLQLQRLKCAELALLAVHPSFHRLLRHIYDVVGKCLARRIQSPLLADAAYLLLKPCEWSARLLLKIIVPEIDSISMKMYM